MFVLYWHHPWISNICWNLLLTFDSIIFQDTIKQLQEELKSIEEAENLCMSFTDWLISTQKSFTALTDSSEPLDRFAMDKKMKKLEVLIY